MPWAPPRVPALLMSLVLVAPSTSLAQARGVVLADLTGVSTVRPLKAAADSLAALGIVLHYTNVAEVAKTAEEQVRQQVRGTHADEIETSMILYIAPERVDMSKAVKDDRPDQPGRLTRQPDGPGLYSPSGVWGDATLATREKGRVVVEATVAGILAEIAALRAVALPQQQ